MIRLAHPKDAEALAKLNQDFNNSPATADSVRSDLQKGTGSEIVLVAEVDNKVVGFACVQMLTSVCYPEPWAELMELYVDPAYRQQGLGGALVQESDKQARERGATEIYLITNQKNKPAQGPYRSQNYELQPHLVYEKQLKT